MKYSQEKLLGEAASTAHSHGQGVQAGWSSSRASVQLPAGGGTDCRALAANVRQQAWRRTLDQKDIIRKMSDEIISKLLTDK